MNLLINFCLVLFVLVATLMVSCHPDAATKE